MAELTRRSLLESACALLAPPLDDGGEGLLSRGYIVRRGRTVYTHVSGRAFTPSGERPFDLRQPFRVASVSKMVTAIGVLEIISRGGISLDDDVSSVLGWRLRHPAWSDRPITARQLLSHTSGLRNGADFPVPFNRSLKARLEKAATEADYGGWFAPVAEPPGVWFAYSDVNFAILAQMAERVTGERFDEVMRAVLFAPLGLDVGYNWSGVSQAKRLRAAAACRREGGAWRPQADGRPPPAPDIALYRGEGDAKSTLDDYRIGENGFAFAPHGGLRLSLRDMDVLARTFARTAFNGALSAPMWTSISEPPNGASENGFFQAYGLGLHVLLGRPRDSYFGASSPEWRGHFGDAYGWMTGLWWCSRREATLVYAINGMPEQGRPQSARTALTSAEQDLIDEALAAVGLSGV